MANLIYCFLGDDVEYPEDVDVIIYDFDALNAEEEGHFDSWCEQVPMDCLHEECEYCYVRRAGASDEEIRASLNAAGICEMPALAERIDELPM
jgi:hypothetical protein